VTTEQQVIDQVRRRVADFEEPRKYEKAYYQDALEFALSKLSFDFDETYSVVADIPNNRVFLLVKLAVIEMAYIRAGEGVGVSEDSDSAGSEGISSLTVPNLSVTGPESASEKEAADVWLNLARVLQDEYDAELEHSGGNSLTAEITSTPVNRLSLTHGGLASRKLDEGLPSVSVAAVVDGFSVSLSWGVLYSDLFDRYEIYRDIASDMETEVLRSSITDNHDVSFVDTVESTGTYYYRVKTVNPNEIKTNSSTLLVTVT